MSPAEEAGCWADRTPTNRWRLVRHHLPLMMLLAGRYADWLAADMGGRAHAYDAYMEAAVDVLWRATAKWDPARGPFGTYVAGYARKIALRELAGETERTAVRDGTRRHSRPPGTTASLDAYLEAGGDVPAKDWRPRPARDRMVRGLVRGACDRREMRLLYYVYWRGMSVAEAARRLGFCRELGRQLRNRALGKLRSAIRRSLADGSALADE